MKSRFLAVALPSSLLLAALAAGSVRPAAAGDEATVRALRLEQFVDGIPASDPSTPTTGGFQSLLIDTGGQRLVLDRFEAVAPPDDGGAPGKFPPRSSLKERLILRLDREPEVVWALAADGTYREHPGDLDSGQKKRRISEIGQLRLLKGMKAAEREAILAENHWRMDGKRLVDVIWGEEKTILDRTCRHLTVTENGRTIIDGYMAEDIPGAGSFFHLYRRLGAFSDEVLKAIRDVQGLPLKASITVVTELPVYTLDVEVLRLEEVSVPPAAFDLPPGARKRAEEPAITRCQWKHCKEAVKTKHPGGRVIDRGRVLYFCSERHSALYKKATFPPLNDAKPKRDGEE